MENKKLLQFLLKDLSELDEIFSEKGKKSFDNLEMEFIQNRVSGAKKLVQLLIDHANEAPAEIKPVHAPELKKVARESPVDMVKTIAKEEDKLPGNRWVEAESVVKTVETETVIVDSNFISETKTEEKTWMAEPPQMPEFVQVEAVEEVVQAVLPVPEILPDKVDEMIIEDLKNKLSATEYRKPMEKKQTPVQRELQLEDEEPVDLHHKRLGDSFSKEKSVNDLITNDLSNLEHKLSNRPVTSLQSSIGINDRFQYIRELFEGNAENYAKTVAELDSLSDLKEAVNYLQTHFKWKKNDTSLKFVSLIKRRFPNE